MKATVKNQLKRYAVLCVGLVVMAFGVAFSIKAGLGTSPISSLPYTLSRITPLSVGTATIAMHVALILLQIILLRRRYNPVQLMQLPVALVFGALTDFSLWVIQGISCSFYPGQWLLCIVGIFLVAFGVTLEVTANVVVLAGEGAMLAICKVFSLKFSNVKVCFDTSLVVIACVLGLIFLGHLTGVREGTVAAAIFVGLTVKRLSPPIQHWAKRYLDEKDETKTA